MSLGFPIVGPDVRVWANDMRRFLGRQWDRLTFKADGISATDDGVVLWDATAGYPVVSKGNEFRQIVLADGHYEGVISADQTAASINTAYALTFTASVENGITNGTPASRIVFEEGGLYMANFSAQIASTSASTRTFYFWPRLNGVDKSNSTIVAALHVNNATTVVSRTLTFEVSAGDYLEAVWAVNGANAFLDASAATAFSPPAPAATISITRLYG